MLSVLSDTRPNDDEPGLASDPDVSFIVAAFNVASFIEQAVRSALNQTNATVEIIVVDDASTDGTAEVVERLAASDPRIMLIRQKKNAGPGAARNEALKRARGHWISILDGDDYVLPGRASALMACAEATAADIVGDNFERVTFDGKPTGRLLFSNARVPFSIWIDAPTFIAANEVLGGRGFSLGAVKVMIRREFLTEHAIRHNEDLPVGEDFQFILACLFRGARFVVTSQPSYKYRLRPGSQSWRLTDEHMTKLRRAQAAIASDAAQFGDEKAVAAIGAYGDALARTTDFVRVVALAKAGKWKEATLSASASPGAWRLVIRYGFQALMNKVRRSVLRARPG